MLRKNKKGLSEVVSYVLLIIIIISMSIIVYVWLKSYLPTRPKECQEGVSLIIQDYDCPSGTKLISLTLENNGRFNITGFIGKVKNISTGLPACGLETSNGEFKTTIFFFDPDKPVQPKELAPGETRQEILSYESCDKIYAIEIIPIIRKEDLKDTLICENAIIKQEVSNTEECK